MGEYLGRLGDPLLKVLFLLEGVGSFFGIWAGIPLFWAVDPVMALAKGDVGGFGVGFGYSRIQGSIWGI